MKGRYPMTNSKAWNEIVENLMERALQEHKETTEYQYYRQRSRHLDEMLTTNLRQEEREFVDEILFEISASYERQMEVLYRRGMRDAVWMLRNLWMPV